MRPRSRLTASSKKVLGTEKAVTVSTSAVEVIDFDKDRTERIIQNQGTISVYLKTTKDVAASGDNLGRLLEGGEIEMLEKSQMPILIKQRQYAITASGSTTLWVWEA